MNTTRWGDTQVRRQMNGRQPAALEKCKPYGNSLAGLRAGGSQVGLNSLHEGIQKHVQRSWLQNVSKVCQHPCWLFLLPISPWGWLIKFFQNKNIFCVHLEATEKERLPSSLHPFPCWVDLSNMAFRIDGIWPPSLQPSLTEHCCAGHRRYKGE